MNADLLHKALVFRAHRFSVIPFARQEKKPALANGTIQRYRRTPADPAQLKAWFADKRGLNIGLVTGRVSGLVVVDIDGDEGLQSIRGLEMPLTPRVLTRRGFHAYFRAPEGLPTRLKALPGVDIIGDDFQVMAPPSVHPSGHRYTWAEHCALGELELALAPNWVIDLAHNRASSQPSTHEPSTPVSDDQMPGAHKKKTKILEDGRAPDVKDTRSTPKCLTLQEVRALFGDFDANLAVATFLGLPPLGSTFLCLRHAEAHPSMSIYRDPRSGAWKVHDWHLPDDDPRAHMGLADLYASRLIGREVRLRGKPTLTVWWLRALVAAKFLEAAEVPRRELPLDARAALRTLYEGWLLLLGCKWRYDPGKPSAFAVRFAMDWCGLSSHTVQECLYQLIRDGYLQRAGRYEGMPVYLPGVD